eukprot:TRINITY_DN5718_c0_g1_i3.p1 TRINITY_DN5718_c0_g1~~TRINITY_DN5718_c0_g1_i3.p1  ORF type:complete len:610 (+),score=113.52 TRINITY_DN5718_c0_g1_i3:11-1840(+)
MDEFTQSDVSFGGISRPYIRPMDDTEFKIKKAAEQLESLDYDHVDSMVEQEYFFSKTQGYFSKLNAQRWLITMVIGILTGLVAFGIDMGVKSLVAFKFHYTIYLHGYCEDCFWLPWLFLAGVCIVFVAFASIPVAFITPVAKGSGIPEIKCYLNGIKVADVLRLKTLLAKAIGVMFSVSGGLSCGKEGPMIHSGSIIAGGVTQGKSTTLPFMRTPFFTDFRSDTEKRDFVSSGAAAGVAAAFGAPIGGVLFSLEEGASFWNQQLTWRTFFCSMVSSFTLNFFKSGTSSVGWGKLSNPGLLNFGDWDSIGSAGYSPQHWMGFILLGILGGLFGALFNAINYRITLVRQRYVNVPYKIFIEALIVAGLSATTAMLLSFYSFNCRKIMPHFNIEPSDTLHFGCPEGYFNDMAGLYLTDQETTIRRLFHYNGLAFSLSTLGVHFVSYFLLATLTYGVGVPSGLFVPALLCGASYGRFVGHVLAMLLPSWDLNPGMFSLIGAASMLGGIARMTISLCVIMMEATGQVQTGLPIMATLLISKFVGDLFNEGLYDIHIHLKQIPILEWDGPLVLRKFTAQHVMSQPVITFNRVENVGRIYSILSNTTHNGFPIVNK